MKTNAFAYHRATTAEEAVQMAAEAGGNARYLAGGQSLLAALNFRLDEPSALIDISRIATLRGIVREGDALVIGALTRHADVAQNADVARDLPLIARAVREVAHPAIRNRGTFGGSVALADPAAEMPACALALGAVLRVLGPGGARRIAIEDFFHGLYETALQAGDLLTHVELPIPEPGARFGFAELARRKGDYAMAGLAMMVGPGLVPAWARVVFFGVSEAAVRCNDAEAAIVAGASPEDCAAVACQGVDVFGDLNASDATKRHYAGVLLKRELTRISNDKSTA